MKSPKFLNELFGETPKKADILIICFFSIIVTLHLIFILYAEIQAVSIIGQVLLILLMMDITGGIIANMTASTNTYYVKRPKLETIFTIIHIQPLIFGLILPQQMAFGAFIYLYSAIATLIALKTRHYAWHRPLAMALLMMGIILSLLVFFDASRLMMILSILFLTKLIYAFGVNHQA